MKLEYKWEAIRAEILFSLAEYMELEKEARQNNDKKVAEEYWYKQEAVNRLLDAWLDLDE